MLGNVLIFLGIVAIAAVLFVFARFCFAGCAWEVRAVFALGLAAVGVVGTVLTDPREDR